MPAAAREALELQRTALPLPGAPALILPADVNHDGRQDLVVVVAYTEWDQIGIEEREEMVGVEGLVMVMTVIPQLMDRRELRVYFGRPKGGFAPDPVVLELDFSVLSVETGPAGIPIIALTDRGISELQLVEGDEGATLAFEPLVEREPVLAGSRVLIPKLGLVHELNGDGQKDLLFPGTDGLAVYLASAEGLQEAPASGLALPQDSWKGGREMFHYYPLPEVREIDGDGLPDVLVPDRRRDWDRFQLFRNQGGGRFTGPLEPLAGHEKGQIAVVHYGDLDGDGVAEYVTEEELDDPDAGWRKELKEAKRPPRRYRLHRSRPDLTMESEPYFTLRALGYAFDLSDSDIRLPGGFQDLDGDSRQDLITLTLDFSLLQAIRVLSTQRISLGLDFHIWCQDEDGALRPVEGLDLSGKFKINLRNFQLGQLSQFAGDFDGDGRTDFLQIGRGRKVTIHRGKPGCDYPARPDLTIRLEEPPLDPGLVQVLDLDGDGLSDLMMTQPERSPEPGVTAPVRLDLYLSGGTR